MHKDISVFVITLGFSDS